MKLEMKYSTVRDPGGRQPVIELQRRFSAATVLMDQAWVTYRGDRENREFFRRYLRTVERCQLLKEAIFRMMGERRTARMERSAA